jgi:putative membrane protein insertion efficiency factor
MSAWPARLAARLVRVYQVVLRPLLPPACRFEPSCSEYSRQVLLTHGLAGGAWLSIRRITRCHPWHAGGYDPPPLRQVPDLEGRPGD